MATKAAFRTLDDTGKLPDNYVNPCYLDDLKRPAPEANCTPLMISAPVITG